MNSSLDAHLLVPHRDLLQEDADDGQAVAQAFPEGVRDVVVRRVVVDQVQFAIKPDVGRNVFYGI